MAQSSLRLSSTDDGRPIHALRRALGKVTVTHVKQREALLARHAASKLAEELFQYQLGFAGKANARPAWQPLEVQFPAPMIPAPMQRDSDLEVPQFTFGYHLYAAAAPVVVMGHVSQWMLDDADYTVGAQLQIGAYTPADNNNIDFAGYVHLTFQGFSGPMLSDDDQGV